MFKPYSTYQAIITKYHEGNPYIERATFRDYEQGQFYLEFRDLIDFLDHFAPHGFADIKMQKSDDPHQSEIDVIITVQIPPDDPNVAEWIKRGLVEGLEGES